MTSPEEKDQALDAIHEEAVRLLEMVHEGDARAIVDTIIALARYKFDVRGLDSEGPEFRDRTSD